MIGAVLVIALSQTSPKVVQEPDKTVYRVKTLVDFDPTEVSSKPLSVQISFTSSMGNPKFPSLIKLRSDMTDKLAASTDNL